MKQYLLLTSALVAGGLLNSGVANAACIKTPTCSSLGYESTTSCSGGLKCPFGNAWNCTLVNKITELEKIIEKNQAEEALKNCKIGDILYSDMSCNANMVASKTPIGVVFDTTNGLAIAKDEFANLTWGLSGDISGIQNYANSSTSTADWLGFKNTKTVYEYLKAQGGIFPAAEKVLGYSTEGTSQGQWYLPAAGELKAISDNKDVLNTTLSKIGGTKMSGKYWSSSEKDGDNVWLINLGGASSNVLKNSNNKARPIINFASKDKVEVKTNEIKCSIGDVLYSDKKCYQGGLLEEKKPIGVVFDEGRRLAIALEGRSCQWSYYYNVTGTSYIYGSEAAKLDFDGKLRTVNGRGGEAFSYVKGYVTDGTKAGDWYFPAGGEVYEILQNSSTLNMTLRALGATEVSRYGTYWSSTEYSQQEAWYWVSSSLYKSDKNDDNTVRPVLAF